MEKAFTILIFIIGCALISLLAHQLSPIIATVAGIYGTYYLQERVAGKLAVSIFLVWPFLVILIGFITMAILALPASLIFGIPFFGYEMPSIFS